MPGASIINLIYFTVDIAGFEQINASWVWEIIVSDNKFVFTSCEK